MNFEKIKKFIKDNNLPSYRVGQIKDLIYKKGISRWKNADTLPLVLRDKLSEKIAILSFTAEKIIKTKDVFKAVLVLKDGKKIESVLLRPFGGHWSVCVSSQVGCLVKCFFCATGEMGFARNLSAEEISDQVLFWFQYIRKYKLAPRISSVVFMGMGEPFLNYNEVLKSVRHLSDLDFLNIGHRNISISTCGLPAGIRKISKDLPQVNLAVSLQSADDRKRNKLVSINKTHNLNELAKTLSKYLQKTKRRVFIEYTLIKNINDSAKDARTLAKWINEMPLSYLLHVNLISCNDRNEIKYNVSAIKVKSFAAILREKKVSVTIRKSLGGEIYAGCGQLAAKSVL
jgi:23S rRNA (adenine(2503)-C(2))-methyltransferase